MDVIATTWDKILEFVYTARFSPVHSLLFRFGFWLLLAQLLIALAWDKGLRSVLVNALIFYIATTTIFSVNFDFLRKLPPQGYIFLLIAATMASFRLPQRIAFYLSPYAGTQEMIVRVFRWLFAVLIVLQFILCWRQG